MTSGISPRSGKRNGAGGFTLLEVVIAVSLTAMVMVMVYSALNMALGIWGKERHRPPDDIYYFMALMRDQIASRLPAKVMIDDKQESILSGDGSALTYATAKSVTSLHGGAPVMVRWVFSADKHLLYYAEAPLMPGQKEYTEDFLESRPYIVSSDSGIAAGTEGKPEVEWFAAQVDSFSFEYQLDKVDDKTSGIKIEWREDEERLHSITVNFREAADDAEQQYVFFPTFLDFKRMKEE